MLSVETTQSPDPAPRPARTPYARGRDFEYRVRNAMRAADYYVLPRSAGSKGVADIVAMRRMAPSVRSPHSQPLGGSEVWMIQCKISGILGVAAWNQLFDIAEQIGATPILAWRDGRLLLFSRLTDRKDGSGSAQPMAPWCP